MARCRCSDLCPCTMRGSPGVTVTGTGSTTDPWVITVQPNATGTLTTNDTPTLNLVRQGVGTQANPFVLTGHVNIFPLIEFQDTADIDFTVLGGGVENSPLVVTANIPGIDLIASADTGDVLTMQPDGTWRASPPNVVAPSVIVTGEGIEGDGSVSAPLRVNLCTYADLKAACAP